MADDVRGDLGAGNVHEAERYDQARQTLRALIAAHSARIGDASRQEAAELREAQADYAEQLRTLDPGDQDAINTILKDYPDLLRLIRGA